jgi:hypothetical protein
MTYNGSYVYEYEITEEEGKINIMKKVDFSKKKSLIKKARGCHEFVYYKDTKIGIYMNEDKPKRILTFNANLFQKVKTDITLTGVYWTSNIIRRTRDLSLLLIRTASREIKIFSTVTPKLDGHFLQISKIPGDKVADFYPFGKNKILTASFDGFITIIQYDTVSDSFSFLSTTEVEVRSGEYFRCGAICQQGKYFAYSTKMNGYIARLFFYELQEDYSVKLLDAVDYQGTKYAEESASNLSSICLDFYCGEFPLLVGVQEQALNYCFLYRFDGKKLVGFLEGEVEHLEGYHQHEVMRVRKVGGFLYSIDESGLLKRTSFVEEREGEGEGEEGE